MKCIQAQESRDCGAACLATVALYYGVRLDIGKLAELSNTNIQGARLDRLRDAAHAVGFAASCGRVRPGQLPNIPLPAILHLFRPEGEHYVTLLKLSGKVATLGDPSFGIVHTSLDDLLNDFSGFALLLKPDENFAPASKAYRGRVPLRITANIVWRNIRAFLLTTVVALLAACASLAIPYFIGKLIDHAYMPGRDESRRLISLLSVFCVVAVARAGFTMVKHLSLAGLALDVEQQHLSSFVEQLLALPLEYFDRRHPGDLIARVNDASQIRLSITGPILNAVLDCTYLVIASFLLFRLNLVLLAVTLTSVVVAFFLHSLLRPKQVVQSRIFRAKMTELMSQVLELVTNIKVLKTFRQEHLLRTAVAKKHLQALAALKNVLYLSGWASMSGLLVNGVGLALLVVMAQELIQFSKFTPGSIAYVIAISSLMMSCTETLNLAVTTLEEVALSVERLAQTERAFSESIVPVQPAIQVDGTSSLEFDSVGFCYSPESQVLTNVSFSVARGEVIGVRGESGSGKSTLAVMCNGLYLPKSGQLRILGKSVKAWDLTVLRERVLVVFNDSNLITGTIHTNIALGTTGVSPSEALEAAKLACADEFIQALPNAYSYRVGHMGFGLSNGQKQRIALARMFLVKPDILILDEATSNLDVRMERVILGNLLAFRKGLTTIIISHRPETLNGADRILELGGGTILRIEENRQVFQPRTIDCQRLY